MWVTQTYLHPAEPNAKVFIYYFFEDYNDSQVELTRRVQHELERMGEIHGGNVSLEAVSKLSEEDLHHPELHEPLVVRQLPLPARDDPAKVVQPSEQPLHLPTAHVATKHPSILRPRPLAVLPVRRDQLGPEALGDPLVVDVAVVGSVPDQAARVVAREDRLDRGLDQAHLVRRSTPTAYCER